MYKNATVINSVTGEGASVSEQLSLASRNPCSIKQCTLEQLYQWTVGGAAVRSVPEAVIGLTFHFDDPSAQDLMDEFVQPLYECWVAARLYGKASMDANGKVTYSAFGNYKGNPDGTILSFYGDRAFNTSGHSNHSQYVSIMLRGYEPLLRYGIAQSVGNNLAQKFGVLTYPVPAFLQNMKDPALVGMMEKFITQMKSLGVLSYDASGTPPSYENIDIDKFTTYLQQCELTVASHLNIPHSLLFARSPRSQNAGQFEIATWVQKLRLESRQFLLAWRELAKYYAVDTTIEVDFSQLLDLYIGKNVDQRQSANEDGE